MPTANNLQTPTEAPLVSPSSDGAPANPDASDNGKVQMKKQLGLVEGVAIILGIIFGSGTSQENYFSWEKRKTGKYFLFVSFCRYFCESKRSHSRGKCSRNVVVNLGDMWIVVYGWCTLLCRIGHFNSGVWWWLCLYQWSLRQFFLLFVLMGCFIHFCVSLINTKMVISFHNLTS